MIESIENALQIGALIICAVVSLYPTITRKSREWMILFFFYGSFLLGDIYWLVCLIFFGDTPKISVVSDLSWYAMYIFLYMLLIQTAPPVKTSRLRALPWLGPIFSVAMAVFFILRGEILSNIIYASLMGLLLFSVICRFIDWKIYKNQIFLSIMILVFCLLEYGLWTASCFWTSDTLTNPYYWFDFLLTVSAAIFLPATKKAVEE
ncbi:MAG: hypothetical protein IJM53_07580 [Lachnospiraceae bacterium]|nr:hypothetical protein [Lachnospiraceae bacterium]